MNKNNLSIVRQQFAQCVFNHKIHEKACDRLERFNNKIKWGNFILLALVIIVLGLQLYFSKYFISGVISISITVIEIVFLFFQKEFSFEEKAKNSKKIALQYLSLRDKYKNFIADIMNDLDENIVILKRDSFQEQYQIINNLAPQAEPIDYSKSQSSLLKTNNTDEEFTWSDREINSFLPKDLHI